jgi:flagellar basal body-associated protein FliL
MANVNKILNLVLKILAAVVLVIVLLVSLATAYIVFAPDTLPKPFYLTYTYPSEIVNAANIEPLETPTPTPLPPVHVEPGEGIMVNSGTKIINISDPTGKRYLRVTIVIELAPTDPKYPEMTGEERSAYQTEFTAEVTTKLPVVDDVIITLVSQKTFEELYTAEGKEKLREEILEKVSERLTGYSIVSVYFTEFVVD